MSSETGKQAGSEEVSLPKPTDTPFPVPRSRLFAAVLVSVGAVVLLGVLLIALFWILGGRWVTVATPSMGESAQVGTLLLTTPVAVSELRIGDIVVFTPPGEGVRSYAHRVVSVADHQIRTKGDINGINDPWVLTPEQIQGVVVARLIGIGWLLQMAPILIIGGAAVSVFTRFYIRPGYRLPATTVGAALVLALAIWIVRPLVGASVINQSSQDGVATTVVVPTGLLEVEVEAFGGSTAVLRPGEVGFVTSGQVTEQGLFTATIGPHLGLVTWVLFGLIWSIPLAVCTYVALVPRKTEQFPPEVT